MLITIRSLKERRFARLKERGVRQDEVKERRKKPTRGESEMRFAQSRIAFCD